MVGEYLVMIRGDLQNLVDGYLDKNGDVYRRCLARHFIYDREDSVAFELMGLKYRTKLARLAQLTSLHMFVVTLRCDYSCSYCQVSRQTEDKNAFDMSRKTADNAIDLVFQSPSKSIKIEFQGGESLLNFELIKYIVEEIESRNSREERDIAFVIATNLTFIDDEILDFLIAHQVLVSSSLDGPARIHNQNRPRPGKNGHQLTVDGIRKVQERLGPNRVAALMTSTVSSLAQVEEIVDEYVRNGLHSIFLRPLSPYGFAVKTGQVNRYNSTQWFEFYKKGLDYIIDCNLHGYQITEVYASIILRKIVTPQDPGYVDLQSPCGAVVSAVVYNYDGDVYASDESRMLAEMLDKKFRLGNVNDDSYSEIFGKEEMLDIIESSMTISVPSCSDCAFLPYCGSDPLYHYATQRDPVGKKALSGFCSKNMSIFRHLIGILEEDGDAARVLMGWLR